MKILTTAAQVRHALEGKRNGTIGFVPTMGALHAGHISLVEQARTQCDTVVVSIFVNPTQFDDPNDLLKYPRTPEADAAMLEAAGTDVVYMPAVEDIYPEPDTRHFDFGPLERVMEGAHRPGHFNGVAQVVSRLFDIVQPGKAYFGEKDFQQLAIIRELVCRLDLPIGIVGCPIVREGDGLAMSSRNTRLTPGQRAASPRIFETLSLAATEKTKGTKSPAETAAWAARRIDAEQALKTEYVVIADAATLQPAARWEDPGEKRIFAAVRAGDIRLIDNMEI